MHNKKVKIDESSGIYNKYEQSLFVEIPGS